MADNLLGSKDRQEALSRAYVQAIAGGAGYSTQPPHDFDRDSVDLTICAGGQMRPKIDVQLKATTKVKFIDGTYRFPLPLKNYNDLRVKTQTPPILVIFDMPTTPYTWINVNTNRLILRRAAYWLSLQGHPETDNETTVTVNILAAQVFDISALEELMEMSRQGVIK